jgi:hypothetical protein
VPGAEGPPELLLQLLLASMLQLADALQLTTHHKTVLLLLLQVLLTWVPRTSTAPAV